MMQKPFTTWQPMMTTPSTMPMQMPMQLPPLHHTVQQCASVCDHMVTAMLGAPDVENRRNQIRLLIDCAHVCHKLATYLASNSPFAKRMASLCAQVCEACGRECARFSDQMSRMCAEICMTCAQECLVFSRS